MVTNVIKSQSVIKIGHKCNKVQKCIKLWSLLQLGRPAALNHVFSYQQQQQHFIVKLIN